MQTTEMSIHQNHNQINYKTGSIDILYLNSSYGNNMIQQE